MVIWPGRSVSTADIFNAPALTRDSESQTIHVFSDLLRNHWPALPGRNDLQTTAAQFEPAVLEALDKLAALGPEFGEPRMTGSGSAVFAPILNGDADASAPELSRLPFGLARILRQQSSGTSAEAVERRRRRRKFRGVAKR